MPIIEGKSSEGGTASEDGARKFGDVIDGSNRAKRRIARGILNNTGIFVGVFIIFVVIVVYTTDIQLTSALEWAALGLSFFVLLMCSYSMYINCADSGTRAGKASSTYIDANDHYDELKKDVIGKKVQGRLPEFCQYYVQEELKNARASILTEVGISYEQFEARYVGKDKAALRKNTNLSKSQLAAVISANKIKPIRLTPEMILKRGRGSSHRSPLGMNPKKKKGIKFSVKFVKICLTSILTSVIVLDVMINPTWATFAACLLKLFPVVLNGFMGYKMGYENVVVDTVNFMNDQADLRQQFIHYVEQTPEPDKDAFEQVEKNEQSNDATEQSAPSDAVEEQLQITEKAAE